MSATFVFSSLGCYSSNSPPAPQFPNSTFNSCLAQCKTSTMALSETACFCLSNSTLFQKQPDADCTINCPEISLKCGARFRYSLYSFNRTAETTPTPESTAVPQKSNNDTLTTQPWFIAVIAIASFIIMVLFIFACIKFKKKSRVYEVERFESQEPNQEVEFIIQGLLPKTNSNIYMAVREWPGGKHDEIQVKVDHILHLKNWFEDDWAKGVNGLYLI